MLRNIQKHLLLIVYFCSAVEVQTIMSQQGERINNEELQELIREADLDGDGFINFQGKHNFDHIVIDVRGDASVRNKTILCQLTIPLITFS